MKLGIRVDSIRNQNTYPEERDRLNDIGFVWEKQRRRLQDQDILNLLAIYKNIYGNLLVPLSFKVPQEHSSWPKKYTGVNLGYIVSHIRNRGSYKSIFPQ